LIVRFPVRPGSAITTNNSETLRHLAIKATRKADQVVEGLFFLQRTFVVWSLRMLFFTEFLFPLIEELPFGKLEADWVEESMLPIEGPRVRI
jgi:hypothetical protein